MVDVNCNGVITICAALFASAIAGFTAARYKRLRHQFIAALAFPAAGVAIFALLWMVKAVKVSCWEEPAKLHEWNTTVSGSEPWTDTYINLKEGSFKVKHIGGAIKVAPTGEEIFPFRETHCLAGAKVFTGEWTVAGLHCDALIARIGDGPAFEVAEDKSMPVQSDGRLYLGINDEYDRFLDNSGSWDLEVVNTEGRQAESFQGAILGKVNLSGYCQSLGASGYTWVGSSAYDLRCIDAEGHRSSIDMDLACKWQYTDKAKATLGRFDDRNTWRCRAPRR